MIKTIIHIALIAFFCFPSFAQDSSSYVAKEVRVNIDKGAIFGTLIQPNVNKENIVVLIIAGSGPTDRDGNNAFMRNNSLKMLSESLGENGIATFRYDKRGIGESTLEEIPEDSMNFENFIDDAILCLKMLDSIGFQKIFIAGHSEGSLIGMVAATQFPVTGYISLAGMGEPLYETLTRQLAPQPEYIRRKADEVLVCLLEGQKVDKIDPMLQSLFRPSIQPFIISFLQYHPTEEIKKLKIPTLIVQGSTDIQVSIVDAQKLHEALPTSTLTIIEGMNHVFKNAEMDRMKNLATYYQPDLPINKELTDTITQFIFNN